MYRKMLILGLGGWVLLSVAVAAALFFLSNAYGLALPAFLAKGYMIAIAAAFVLLLLLPLVALLLVLLLAVMIVLLLGIVLLPVAVLIGLLVGIGKFAGMLSAGRGKKRRRESRESY